MCGIAGKYCLTVAGGVSGNLIQQMTSVLHHRGPDESGIYLDDWVGLGQARLSIIDLDGGSQPIHNEDGSLWIIYNGEIFNYLELKQELLKKGHTFYTATDTEVILHLYEEKGKHCLEDLNGQFAFAIWDSKEKELFLARDRVGIRPLYYTVQNSSLLFASEIKSIFMDRTIERQLEPGALNQIFTFWTTLPGKTVFKGINELPPGHFMVVAPDKITMEKYWDLPFYPPEAQLDWPVKQICEKIQELLTDAIRIRLRADVPVGCYLSGGLDSSGVTTLVVKNFNSQVRTFGIRFEEDGFDEGTYQQQMVTFLNTNHTEIQASNEKIGSALPDVIWHCEKPLLRTAPVPLFLLSQVVNQSDFKVVLTGEGADEVFGGYNIFREAKVRNFWAKQPDSKTRGLLIGKLYPYIFNNPKLKFILQSFFAPGLDRTADPFFSHRIRWKNTGKIKVFLAKDLTEAIDPESDHEILEKMLPPEFASWDYLARAQYLEMAIFLSNYLLSSQGDRVAMAHSVEIRLPYLDYRLLDFMGRVPARWKIRGLNEKYILKKSFTGILPDAIAKRPKHPYRAPIKSSLLNGNSGTYTREVLSDHALKNAGLFDVTKVNGLLKKLDNSNNTGEVENMALAGILTSQLVYDKFIVNFPVNITPIPPDIIVDQRTVNSIR